MAEDKNLTQLIINEMTKAQYEALDKVNEDEIYILTDVDTTIHTDNSTLQGDGSTEKPIGLSDTIISTLNNKQDKLTAGTNISIEDNVISSTIPIATETQAGINRTYTSGANISIEDNVISSTMPIATDTQTGITKLYTTSGTNTDGAMTQKAVGDAISAHNTATDAHSNIRGVAGGLATLDNNAKVPMSQINDALIGNVSYQGLWDAATNTPFLADPTGGLPAGYNALGYINFTSNTFIDTGVFISETDETVEYDIKMTPSNTGCFPFGAAGSEASTNNTGSVYFYGSTLEYFAGSTRSIRLGEVVKDKDYIINIKLDQTTQTITVIENDLRTTQSYSGSIISPVSIILGGLRYGTASNPTHGFGYSGKIHYFVIRKNGIMVKQYQPAQRISDGAYGFYEHVSGEFVVSSGALFASGGGEIEIPKGYYYITTVAGDRFGLHFDVGDWIISAGGYWSKVDNTDAVVSVNGRTGNVVITTEDLDLSNYVQNTDIATYNKAGLLLGTGNGFRANVRGLPQCDSLTTTSYPSASNAYFISKGTIENLKYDIVKRAITTNNITLTDSEKEKARNWIGASAPTAFETMPDVNASAGEIYQYVGETTEELTSGYFYKSVPQGVSYITSDPNVTFNFDLFWSELESAGITLETLQMIEEDKEHGGFTIIGTAESETNYRVQEINGVQVYALLTQSVQVASSYVGVTNKWYYKPTETFAWERVDVQPAPDGCLTKEEADATYLQLTGGTITGEVVIKNDSSDTIAPLLTLSHGSNDIVIKKSRYSKILNFDNALLDGVSGITPIQSNGELGSNGAFWSKVYVRNLNAGAPSGKDLLVPSKEGTLATLDDIPAATQFEVLPEISENNIGEIVQYTGETTNNYTQGHFYKSTKTITRNIVSSGYTLDAETNIVVNVRIDQFLSHNPVFADPSVSGTQYPAWRADYGGAGFWNIWTQTPNISISETELKNIWGVSIVDENGLPYTPVAGDNITIEQQEEINYHWEEINFSEDYLPLSGGELTGPLNINGAILSSQYDNELKIGLIGVDEIINMNLASGSIISVTDSGSLGSGEHKWKTVYTTTLNNGADLVLPTEGGTLARTEDIQGVNTNINNHINNTSNPHSVTKAQVGLENVDNTADLDKPISTATQAALDEKQNALTTGTGIKLETDTISITDDVVTNKTQTTGGSFSVGNTTGKNTGSNSTHINSVRTINKAGAISIGHFAETTGLYGIGIGFSANAGYCSVGIGYSANAAAEYSVQLGDGTNTNENTLQFRDYPLVDAEGNIYSDRLIGNAIVKYLEMPSVSSKYNNIIVQYAGATTDKYINGYFYKGSYVVANTYTVEENQIGFSISSIDTNKLMNWFTEAVHPSTPLDFTNKLVIGVPEHGGDLELYYNYNENYGDGEYRERIHGWDSSEHGIEYTVDESLLYDVSEHIKLAEITISVTDASWKQINVQPLQDLSGYAEKTTVQQIQQTLDTKADKSDTYTKTEVDAKVSSVYRFMGSVATVDALPADATVGDTYNIEADGSNYAWTGTTWDKLSETVNLTPYLTKEDATKTYDTITSVNNKLLTKQDTLVAGNNISITNNTISVTDFESLLPDQEGHEDEVLSTDGSNAKWTGMPGLIIRRL